MSLSTLHPIIDAIQSAAKLCQAVQARYVDRLSKSGNEPVTIADYGVQAILCRAISHHFPHDAVIAEESAAEFQRTLSEAQRHQIVQLVSEVLGEPVTVADLIRWLDHGRTHNSETLWVIDPIDGTRGFLSNQRYVIGVGVLEGGLPVGGFMGCPEYNNQLLYAWDGLAYTQPLDSPIAQPLNPAPATSPANFRLVQGHHPTADQQTLTNIYKSLGVTKPSTQRIYAQLDAYALIACGDADLFLCDPITRCSPKIWDNAAGIAIVEASGGYVTDLAGQALDCSDGQKIANASLLVSNGAIHQQILDTCQREAI